MECGVTYHSLTLAQGHSTLSIEVIHEVMSVMSWHDGVATYVIDLDDGYAWHRGSMPCAQNQLSHGLYAMDYYYNKKGLGMTQGVVVAITPIDMMMHG